MAIILFITPQEYDFCPLVFDMSRYLNEIQKSIPEYEATTDYTYNVKKKTHIQYHLYIM